MGEKEELILGLRAEKKVRKKVVES